jgi:hypothetical protein
MTEAQAALYKMAAERAAKMPPERGRFATNPPPPPSSRDIQAARIFNAARVLMFEEAAKGGDGFRQWLYPDLPRSYEISHKAERIAMILILGGKSAAEVLTFTKALADGRATCPTTDGRDLELWETICKENAKAGA